MTSDDLARLGFGDWRSFSLSEEKTLLANLPRKIGVYAIRDMGTFGRYRGESDLVYIGSTINSAGLKRRIRFYFDPGQSQQTSKRIRGLLDQIQTLEISWALCKGSEEARSLEKDLLAKYFRDHFELPPFNRQG